MKRTVFDFSKHEHRVEIFKSDENEIRVDHLQIERNRGFYIKFTNTDDIMTVNGDFGNWIFCRPFIPSVRSNVSDMYWMEKLKMYSRQEFKIDLEGIEQEIQELLKGGLEEIYSEENIEEAKQWYMELLNETDDEISYISKAYRDPYKPCFIDYEDIPYYKKTPYQLLIIFDAFDEICSRIKTSEQ